MKKYTPPLTENDQAIIVKMFHEGHGPQSIGIKLKLSSGKVTRFLESIGLRRTMSESKAAKPYCWKRGPIL